MAKLAGRVAIVTGGSRGIGREIAIALARQGARVVITYNSSSPEAAHGVVSEMGGEGNGLAIKADVAAAGDVAALFSAAEHAFGQISILINSAGQLLSAYPKIEETSVEDWDRIMSVNTRGTFLACKEAAKRMAQGGRIVNLSSSTVGGNPIGYGVYVASKAAVEGMSKVLAKELGSKRITVNCVAPGPVAGDMFFAGKSEQMINAFTSACPMERLGEPHDIVPVVLFVVSDEAQWLNGQVVRVNGGLVV